ncbi:MAG: hypothetical protein GY859_06625, partial [Desulfobacterales bacterium]|nr:hypothetical protein [Desulfobacterales bacterium]
MPMTHDQNFKNLILDYPRPVVEFYAAEEAENITSDARVIPVREEQLKDRLGDRFHEVDTPVMVEWPDGKRKAIVFLFEEETEPRHFSIHRLGRYCLHLGELLETDRVVPVVIFLRPGDHPRELTLSGDHGAYLSFRY